MKNKTLVLSGAAIASAAALAVGGAAFANAGSAPPEAGRYGYAAPGYGGEGAPGRGHGPWSKGGRAGQGLSGDTAVKVVEAAVAKEPTATLSRLGKADDGTYRVLMRRTDGTRVLLTLDANFTVSATQEQAPRAEWSPKPSPTATPSATT